MPESDPGKFAKEVLPWLFSIERHAPNCASGIGEGCAMVLYYQTSCPKVAVDLLRDVAKVFFTEHAQNWCQGVITYYYTTNLMEFTQISDFSLGRKTHCALLQVNVNQDGIN